MTDSTFFDQMLAQSGLTDLFSPARTVPAMREAMARMEDLVEVSPPSVAEVRDIEIAGGDGARAARIYIPHGISEAPGPGLIFFHGVNPSGE